MMIRLLKDYREVHFGLSLPIFLKETYSHLVVVPGLFGTAIVEYGEQQLQNSSIPSISLRKVFNTADSGREEPAKSKKSLFSPLVLTDTSFINLPVLPKKMSS